MSTVRRAMFSNQLVTIEPVASDGSNLTITCPVNDPNYMRSLQAAVQTWKPRLHDQGHDIQISTHAEILNNQVVCSLTPESGSLNETQLQRFAIDLENYLGTQTGRTMSAAAGEGTSGGSALQGDVETRGA